jgi:hypothetical protein
MGNTFVLSNKTNTLLEMKNSIYLKTTFVFLSIITFSISAIAQGIHKIDSRLVGKWMWTQASSGAYFSESGVYKGSAYGFAIQYSVNADGSGTCFKHVQSTLGIGSSLTVDISYTGFFEMDDQGHMGFFPTGGTYTSSSSGKRALRADELWNTQTNKGVNYLYQKLQFTAQGGRFCYQVTSSDGKVDTFFKL